MTEAWTADALKALRAACHTADGLSLLALLRTRVGPGACLDLSSAHASSGWIEVGAVAGCRCTH